MELSKNKNSVTRTINNTFDNTQRLIRNVNESFKRFNQNNRTQKLNILFKHKLKKYLWTGYFVFCMILVINVIIMTFYLVDSGYNYNLMDHSYVDAVLPSQDVGGVMDLGIVRIEKVSYLDLSIGDKVVIYGDFSIDIYWVETIVGLDDATKSIELTYDNVSTNTYHIDDVIGQYASNANFFGTLYYSSMYLRGFMFLASSSLLLMYGYWYAFLSNKDSEMINLFNTNYREDLGVLSSLDKQIILEEAETDLRGVEVLIPPAAVSNVERARKKAKAIEAENVLTSDHFIRSKGDIIEYITAHTGLSNYKGKMFLKYFAEVITEELSKGNDIHIIKFGKFTTVTMPAKDAVNPRTNEKIIVPEHKQARVRFYNEVKSKL